MPAKTYNGPWRWRWAERLWLRRLVIVVCVVPAFLVNAYRVLREDFPAFVETITDSWRRHEDDR